MKLWVTDLQVYIPLPSPVVPSALCPSSTSSIIKSRKMPEPVPIQKDLSIAIVGGGMGGLAAGVALGRAGVKVDLFEQAPKFEEVGAGIK
jgi:ribulose 1,5-bisphosphate synthetase/thiazole synthase